MSKQKNEITELESDSCLWNKARDFISFVGKIQSDSRQFFL